MYKSLQHQQIHSSSITYFTVIKLLQLSVSLPSSGSWYYITKISSNKSHNAYTYQINRLKFTAYEILLNDYNIFTNYGRYLFTIFCFPVHFLFYKHLLRACYTDTRTVSYCTSHKQNIIFSLKDRIQFLSDEVDVFRTRNQLASRQL